jgi:hypothetical protein
VIVFQQFRWQSRFFGYHFCGIGNRRSDVFAGQTWIRVQKVRFTTDFRKLAEDELNGNACLTDDWLAQHHPWMSGNALGKNHITPSRWTIVCF